MTYQFQDDKHEERRAEAAAEKPYEERRTRGCTFFRG